MVQGPGLEDQEIDFAIDHESDSLDHIVVVGWQSHVGFSPKNWQRPISFGSSSILDIPIHVDSL
jgi:hypothetical protein